MSRDKLRADVEVREDEPVGDVPVSPATFRDDANATRELRRPLVDRNAVPFDVLAGSACMALVVACVLVTLAVRCAS